MATRTAPLMTATATGRAITIHLMDVSGDTWTERLVVAIGATAAAIEAWVAFYQALTNATVWKITDEIVREGDADPDNAVAAFRAATENGINLTFKDPATRASFTLRAVAPIAAIMQGNQDIPLLSATELTDFITGTLALVPSYDFKSSQYTVHRERSNNPKVK